MKKYYHYFLFVISYVLFISFYAIPPLSNASGNPLNKSDSNSIIIKNYPSENDLKLVPAGDKPLSTDEALTKAVYQNINVSNNSYPQNEPSIKISRKNPDRIVAAWRDFRTGVEPANRKIGYSYSTDGGITWQPSSVLLAYNPFYKYSSDPAVCTDTAGNFYISVISIDENKTNSNVCVYKSTDEGETFEEMLNVSPHPDSVNYGDDKSYIVCDLINDSPYKNTLYVFWSTDSTSVFSKSTDCGKNWSKCSVIVPNGGYALIPAIGPQGDIFVAWLDMQNGSKYGLHVSKSTDGGQSFTSKFINTVAYTSSFTRFPSIAADVSGGKRNGYVYLVWSNKSQSGNDETIYFSSSSDKGETWQPPKKINYDSMLTQRNQYWPSVTVNGYGNIYITYYDTRNTSHSNIINSYIARSSNGGKTFHNMLLSSSRTYINYQNNDIRFGDYISIDSWKNKIIPIWTDERAGGYDMEIYSSIITDSTIGITAISNEIPSQYNLILNSPALQDNTNKKSFSFLLPSFSNYSTYNVFGSEISVLANEKHLEDKFNRSAGYCPLDAVSYPDGLYLNRVNFGMYIQTAKLLLLK